MGLNGAGWLRKLLPIGVVALWLVVLASAVGQGVLLGLARWPPDAATQASPADFADLVVLVVLASFGALVALRSDSRRYGWLMLSTGVAIGVVGSFGLFGLYGLETGAPLDSFAIWIQDLWMVSQLLLLLLLPALLPDGKTASPRWGLPVRVATIAWITLIVLFALAERPATNVFLDLDSPPTNPMGLLPIPMEAFNVTWALLALMSVVIGIGSLVTRWRRADLELRQRLKWILYAFGLLLSLAGLSLVTGVLKEEGINLGLSTPLDVLSSVASLGLAVALGFAVLRFRLYDINLVINRTIVYGVLTAAVVLTYMAVVVGVGALLAVRQSFLALIATGIVAAGFAPLRARVQGWINRLMFGQRDDPYAVLSKMGRLLSETGAPEDTLETLTETVATSLKLPGATIELEQDGGWVRGASFGTGGDVEAGGLAIPLRHQGELIGRLVVMPRSPRDPLTAQDIALLEEIAHPAGAIARSVRLTRALQSSRERLVMAVEEERRRIRRDLHDGLGPALASQMFQLDEVLDRLHDDPAGSAALVMGLKDQNRQLVADIRRLVYELRPPALDELGIASALRAHVTQFERSGQLRIEVRTIPDPLPALPAAVEVAAYRIAREAITNTARHAGATRCTAVLEANADKVTISVCDDGRGIDRTVEAGVGLIAMRERSEELGGTFKIVSSTDGTEIMASFPLMDGSQSGRTIPATDPSGAGVRRG